MICIANSGTKSFKLKEKNLKILEKLNANRSTLSIEPPLPFACTDSGSAFETITQILFSEV
jgi:hypothetical protein